MPLVFCPECGHEISDAALACPNCGRPLQTNPVVEEVVVKRPPARESDIPKWVYIPIAVIGGLAILLLFLFFFRSEDDPNNVNVKVSANRRASETRQTTTQTVPSTDTGTVTVPSTSVPVPPTDSQTVTVPGSSVTTPSESRGTVALTARVASRTGQPRPVRNERFYLLDKDIESILSEANVDPIEGNSLLNSFGLSVLYPGRYGDFNRRALAAIRSHIKHTATSDASGKAEFSGVEPDQYYLFGVTRGDQGFAVWSSPVSIRAGVNNLNLSPQPLTEISG